MNETTLSENNNWSTVLTLNKYDKKGKLILYEIDEKEVPTRYKKHIEQTTTNNIKTYCITNSYQFKFNIALKQTIEKVIINNQEKNVNNNIYKLEIPKKQKENNIKIYYEISVSNNSEIEGSTEIYDYIPEGYNAIQEENPEWNISNNIAIKNVKNMQIGETRKYTIILTKNRKEKTKTKTIENKVIAQNSTNKAGVDETTLEDNTQTTNCILSISTGIEKIYNKHIYIILFICINIALILAILRHKRKSD